VVVACGACVVSGGISGLTFPLDADLVASGSEILNVEWLVDIADEMEEEFHGDLFLC